MNTYHSHKFRRGWCFRWKRCGSWVFENEFLNTKFARIHAKLNFTHFITWSDKYYRSILIYLMSISKVFSYTIDSFFSIYSIVLSVNINWIFCYQMSHFWGFRVNMLKCIINTILANKFTWESVAIRRSSDNRNSVMHKVNIFLCPLFKIFNKSIVIMSSWYFKTSAFIIVYKDH